MGTSFYKDTNSMVGNTLQQATEQFALSTAPGFLVNLVPFRMSSSLF